MCSAFSNLLESLGPGASATLPATHKNQLIVFFSSSGSSWGAFFRKVAAVKSPNGAESLAHPRVVHGAFKFVLATTGTLLNLLGLRSTMTYTSFGCNMSAVNPSTQGFDLAHFSWGVEDPSCVESGPEMFAFWLSGTFLIVISTVLTSFHGRRFVLFVTNSLSSSIGVTYRMHDQTLVVKPWHTPTPGVRGEPGDMNTRAKFLTWLADMSARFSALTDPEMQKVGFLARVSEILFHFRIVHPFFGIDILLTLLQDQRNRGSWKKKDTYAMFYGDFNHNGMIWVRERL